MRNRGGGRGWEGWGAEERRREKEEAGRSWQEERRVKVEAEEREIEEKVKKKESCVKAGM